jgi:hypothetical protein
LLSIFSPASSFPSTPLIASDRYAISSLLVIEHMEEERSSEQIISIENARKQREKKQEEEREQYLSHFPEEVRERMRLGETWEGQEEGGYREPPLDEYLTDIRNHPRRNK